MYGSDAAAPAVFLAIVLTAVVIAQSPMRAPDAAQLQRMAARFAPTDIGADLSKLSDADRTVLGKLVDASKLIDGIYLRQVWSGNAAMLMELGRDPSPEGR